MLRDMEELLNTVVDDEAKDYLREAMNCYNIGSYKACVIMSVIAGSYDLHNKVKALASSHRVYRELDDEVEKLKNNLEAYERYLCEQCATKEVDMLNSNELKELGRCLDVRNDCAHPSNFKCSAEKARDVYSSIIDIICSKPVLYGCKNLNMLIDELKEETFFPVIENNKVSSVVKENIDKFHSSAIPPLIKKISQNIINSENQVLSKNSIYFFCYGREVCRRIF